jgi:hypothetical protein
LVGALEVVSTVLGELKALDLHVMDRLASMRNCKTLEPSFCGLVTEGSVRFDLIRG